MWLLTLRKLTLTLDSGHSCNAYGVGKGGASHKKAMVISAQNHRENHQDKNDPYEILLQFLRHDPLLFQFSIFLAFAPQGVAMHRHPLAAFYTAASSDTSNTGQGACLLTFSAT